MKREYFDELTKRETREEFLRRHTGGEGCPSSVGLRENCDLSCRECWRAAVANIPFVGDLIEANIYVKQDGNTTVAVAKNKEGKLIGRGIAKKHVEDEHNTSVGMFVALARALHLDATGVLQLVSNQELLEELGTRL